MAVDLYHQHELNWESVFKIVSSRRLYSARGFSVRALFSNELQVDELDYFVIGYERAIWPPDQIACCSPFVIPDMLPPTEEYDDEDEEYSW